MMVVMMLWRTMTPMNGDYLPAKYFICETLDPRPLKVPDVINLKPPTTDKTIRANPCSLWQQKIMGLLNNFLGKKNFQFLFERLHRLSLKGMNYGRASDYQHNGESEVLKRVCGMIQSDLPVLFDVGANQGEFTKGIMDVWQGKAFQLYAFEPSQKTFAMLQNSIQKSESVHLVNMGLGERHGNAELFSDREGSGRTRGQEHATQGAAAGPPVLRSARSRAGRAAPYPGTDTGEVP